MSTMITGGGGGGTSNNLTDATISGAASGDTALTVQEFLGGSGYPNLLNIVDHNGTTQLSIVSNGGINANGKISTTGFLEGNTVDSDSGHFYFRTQASQTLVATTVINPGQLTPITSASAITLTAAPTINAPNSIFGNVETIKLYNAGSFTITFQDKGTLTGSSIILSSGTTLALPAGKLVEFTYLSNVGGVTGWRQSSSVL